jgi:CRP-like cAMP-binding protein
MALENDIAFFQRVPTLSILGEDALRILAIGAESRYLDEGQVLFRAGDLADAAYVIQEGSFRLLPAKPDGAKEIIVGPGTLLGELALLTQTSRPATATALEPAVLMRIPRGLFRKMLEGYPVAASRLREYFATRAERTRLDLSNIRAVLAGDAPSRSRE